MAERSKQARPGHWVGHRHRSQLCAQGTSRESFMPRAVRAGRQGNVRRPAARACPLVLAGDVLAGVARTCNRVLAGDALAGVTAPHMSMVKHSRKHRREHGHSHCRHVTTPHKSTARPHGFTASHKTHLPSRWPQSCRVRFLLEALETGDVGVHASRRPSLHVAIEQVKQDGCFLRIGRMVFTSYSGHHHKSEIIVVFKNACIL